MIWEAMNGERWGGGTAPPPPSAPTCAQLTSQHSSSWNPDSQPPPSFPPPSSSSGANPAPLSMLEDRGSCPHRRCVPEVGIFAKMGLQQYEDLDHCLAVAVDAAKKAGEVILDSFHKAKAVELKGMHDLVTETDKACEDAIFTQLKTSFPSHEFIGEETSSMSPDGIPLLTDAPTWVVDPLDGTTNFVHRFPFVCVSIGLVINKVPVVGVVYNPILDELFTGIEGKGAFLNGERIQASSQESIGNALLATEVGVKREKVIVDRTTNLLNQLMYKVRSLRLSGSCAMNLCGVACGRLDLFYEIGFGGPWDVAAGTLILREAGGLVFDPHGGEFDMMSHLIAASNGHLKQALVDGMAGLV